MLSFAEEDLSIVKKTLEANGYELKELIGRGGFSVVYKAFSQQYQEDFAVKISLLSTIDQEVNSELEILSTVHHTNIVSLYKYFSDEKFVYYIMEYCTGGSLEAKIRKGPIRENDLIQYMVNTMQALICCKTFNIAHRDIKPGNLLIDQYGRVKLCDFGLARVVKEKQMINEHSGSVMFCAPEVLRKKSYDPFMADIWSLGVTFFYLSTGLSPYLSFGKEDIRELVRRGQVANMHKAPSAFVDLFSKMLRFNPSDRIQLEDVMKDSVFVNSLARSKKKRNSAATQFKRSNATINALFRLAPSVSHQRSSCAVDPISQKSQLID